MDLDLASEPRDADDDWGLSRFLSFRIAKLHAVLNAQATRLLEDGPGLTLGQWRVMVTIGAGGARTSRALHEKTQIDPALISRSLRQLEALGFVVAGRNAEDRRVLDVRLTPRGDEVFRQTYPIMQARQNALRGCLTPDEAAQLDDFIARLTRVATSG